MLSQYWAIVHARRDLQAYVALAGLVYATYENALTKEVGTKVTSKQKYARAARGILQLGEIQRGVLEAYMRPTCVCCRKKNPQCSCEVRYPLGEGVSNVRKKRFVVEDVLHVREALHGMECLKFYRKGKIQNEAWDTINMINSYKSFLEMVRLENAYNKHDRKLHKFIRRALTDSPLQD